MDIYIIIASIIIATSGTPRSLQDGELRQPGDNMLEPETNVLEPSIYSKNCSVRNESNSVLGSACMGTAIGAIPSAILVVSGVVATMILLNSAPSGQANDSWEAWAGLFYFAGSLYIGALIAFPGCLSIGVCSSIGGTFGGLYEKTKHKSATARTLFSGLPGIALGIFGPSIIIASSIIHNERIKQMRLSKEFPQDTGYNSLETSLFWTGGGTLLIAPVVTLVGISIAELYDFKE